MVGRRDRGHVGHWGVRHGRQGSNLLPSFQNAVGTWVVLLLDICGPTLPVRSRCQQDQAEPAPSLRCSQPLAVSPPPVHSPISDRQRQRRCVSAAFAGTAVMVLCDQSARSVSAIAQLDRQAVCAAQSDQVAMVAAAAARSSSSSSSVAPAPPLL